METSSADCMQGERVLLVHSTPHRLVQKLQAEQVAECRMRQGGVSEDFSDHAGMAVTAATDAKGKPGQVNLNQLFPWQEEEGMQELMLAKASDRQNNAFDAKIEKGEAAKRQQQPNEMAKKGNNHIDDSFQSVDGRIDLGVPSREAAVPHTLSLAVALGSIKGNYSSLSKGLYKSALSKTVNAPSSSADSGMGKEERMTLALNLLRTESPSLLKRCMLIAGFQPDQTEECDAHYLEFSKRAVKEEWRRVARIESKLGVHKGCCDPGEEDMAKVSCDSTKNSNSSETHSGQNPSNVEQQSDDKHNCFGGRHIHRLEGKCGHEAVIHKPEGGQPHVDFVVNGKIECYEGVQGFKCDGNSEALWPSQFNCNELTCENTGNRDHKASKLIFVASFS